MPPSVAEATLSARSLHDAPADWFDPSDVTVLLTCGSTGPERGSEQFHVTVTLGRVSGSMRASDVKPSRLGAAQNAMATFAERMSPVLDPAQRIEYATLLARDEEARARRQEAFDALGLSVPSLEEEP